MGVKIRITQESELDLANEVIHDYRFDLDEVTFDENTCVLEIRFLRPSIEGRQEWPRWRLFWRVEVPYLESFLRINHVSGWALEDTEHIGSYDFNEICFDEAASRVWLKTGVPLRLHADVTTLDIIVIVTDKVVKLEKRTWLGLWIRG